MVQTIQFKRTLTPDNPPASLAVGEFALGVNDTPVKMWVGTPSGVQEIVTTGSRRSADAMMVEDAPSDSVYGRCNGEWTPVPFVGTTVPTNPVPNALWCDTSTMKLFIYFNGLWHKIND